MNPSTPLWRFWQGNNKKRIEFTSNTFFFFFLLWKLVGCHSEGVGSIVKKHSWTAHLDGGVLVWMEPRASLNQLRSAHGQWSILFASHGLYFIIKIPVFAFRLELFSGLMNVIFFFFFFCYLDYWRQSLKNQMSSQASLRLSISIHPNIHFLSLPFCDGAVWGVNDEGRTLGSILQVLLQRHKRFPVVAGRLMVIHTFKRLIPIIWEGKAISDVIYIHSQSSLR